MGAARSLPAEGAWSGQACYVIGGGPSLTSFNWDLLKSKRNIIVINLAFLKVPHADIWFSEDLRVVEELIEKKEELKAAWSAFNGVKVFHSLDDSFTPKALAACPDLHVIERKRRDKFWATKWEEGLSYSSHSFIGAANIATILDADPIYCLGLDCRAEPKVNPNFHSHYPNEWRMPVGQGESYRSDVEHWAALHMRGRSVVNLVNSDYLSAVTCWPRVPWGEVL